ncbi:MAG: hypothetical protein K2X81_19690, partial [Candidatus Obscuribacterales bacterium]|nr:hypothetical protein [Candidatus Obscuribacterales bacterium]
MRKARAVGSTRFQKTTEFNVQRKLKRELDTARHEQAQLDARLDQALNRETNHDIFNQYDSLAGALPSFQSTIPSSTPFPPSSLFQSAPDADPHTLPQQNNSAQTQSSTPPSPEKAESGSPKMGGGSFFRRGVGGHLAHAWDQDDGNESGQAAAGQGKALESNQEEIEEQARIQAQIAAIQAQADRDARAALQAQAAREEEAAAAAAQAESYAQAALEAQSAMELQLAVQAQAERDSRAAFEAQAALQAQIEQEEDAIRNQIELDAQAAIKAQIERDVQAAIGGQMELQSDQADQADQADVMMNFVEIALKFKSQTGLDLVLNDSNNINLFLNANGDNINLYSVDFSDSGVEEAEFFTIKLIEQYIATLSRDFGIEFGRAGEISVRQFEYNDEGEYFPGKLLRVRLPRLDELKALHRAIEFSWPSSYQLGDQLPMRVVFTDDTLVKGERSGARLKYMEDGRPILFITPLLCTKGVPTEFDPVGNDNRESWQATIMRELAWKAAADCNKLPLSPDDYGLLGWWPIMSEEYQGLYALKTTDDHLYAPYEDAETAAQAWARCDQNGVLLNADGEPSLDLSDVSFLSHKEMAKRAKIRPCGDYFYSADEELVDALRCFRQGPEWRLFLGKNCPQLYRAARSLDQLCINRCYVPSKGYA